jgi:HK97 family phage major capsid protein/HK97 family phage prohead protease
MFKRAYSLLEIKSFNEETREITGIATTPTPDSYGDIVEPKGADFKLPIPFLYQHDASQPIGHVTKAKVSKEGIEVVIKLVKTDEPGTLKDRLDEAWQSIKLKLVRGLSIGFRSIEHTFIEGTNGIHFLKWLWLELSAVTIPANSEATITAIKSIDAQMRAASGRKQKTVVRLKTLAGVTAKSKTKPMEANMNTQDKIRSLEAKRLASSERMSAIMAKADNEGRTLDEAEAEEFDTLEAEVKAVDEDLVRQRALEKIQLRNAKSVDMEVDDKAEKRASANRAGVRVELGKSNLPKGTAFTRYAMSLLNGKGSVSDALKYAERWKDSTPEVLEYIQKAAAGTTTAANWAAPLVDQPTIASEFIELLRPMTILGKMTGVRRAPFNIKMARQTTGALVNWVGQGLPKPVGELAFDTVELGFTKVAGIVVITEELARLSTPSAEEAVRRDLTEQIAAFIDQQFIDPDVTANAGVNPAAVTQSVASTAIAASGNDAAALRCDLRDLFMQFTSNNLSVAGSVFVMSETMATSISLLTNDLGQPEFPGISATGGTLVGIPVITSESVPTVTAGSLIVLIKQGEILLADDGVVTLDVSREATLNMADTNPSTAATFNLWQRNCLGLRAERWINYVKRRPTAVAFIKEANYGSCAT